MSDIKFSTTPYIDGYTCTKNHGVITATAVLGVSAVSEAVSSIKDFFGGRSGTMQNILEEGHEFVFDDLRKQAVELTNDREIGIVGLTIKNDHLGTGAKTGMLLVTGTGTVVTIEKRSPNLPHQ